MGDRISTPVRSQAERAADRRSRLRRLGPHYRNPNVGRPARVPYERIAECYIAAVREGAWPVQATAVAVGVNDVWLMRTLHAVRQVGWLPKGPPPLPGEDPLPWLARAEALLTERRVERAFLQEKLRRDHEHKLDRDRARERDRASYERALKPPTVVLDQFPLL